MFAEDATLFIVGLILRLLVFLVDVSELVFVTWRLGRLGIFSPRGRSTGRHSTPDALHRTQASGLYPEHFNYLHALVSRILRVLSLDFETTTFLLRQS